MTRLFQSDERSVGSTASDVLGETIAYVILALDADITSVGNPRIDTTPCSTTLPAVLSCSQYHHVSYQKSRKQSERYPGVPGLLAEPAAAGE